VRPRALFVVLVVLVALVGSLAACSRPAQSDSAAGSWSTVFKTSGSGKLTTSTFRLSGRAGRVSWNFQPPRGEGSYFELRLVPARTGAKQVRIYGTRTAAGTGSCRITAPPGDYSIRVLGDAPWTVAVEELQ
jgi:hypothetical protein